MSAADPKRTLVARAGLHSGGGSPSGPVFLTFPESDFKI